MTAEFEPKPQDQGDFAYLVDRVLPSEGEEQTTGQKFLRDIWEKLDENLSRVSTAEIKPHVANNVLGVLEALFGKQIKLVGPTSFNNKGRSGKKYVCRELVIDGEEMEIELDVLSAYRTKEVTFYPKLKIIINGRLTQSEIALEARPNIYYGRRSRTREAILLYPISNSGNRTKIDELPRGAFADAIKELVENLHPSG